MLKYCLNWKQNSLICEIIPCLKKLIISSNCKVGPSEILQRGKGGLLFRVGDHNKLYNLLKNVKINDIHTKKKINFTTFLFYIFLVNV